MPELKPALLLPYADREMRPRIVSGRTPPPLVPVTEALREQLRSEIAAVQVRAAGASNADPLPVKLRLRSGALSKSKRPYSLLADVELTPSGAAQPGELILPATPFRLQNLSRRIERGRSQADLFAISTIETIVPWETAEDIFNVSTRDDAERVLDEGLERGRPLRVTFFPWVDEVVRESAALAKRHGQAITDGAESDALIAAFERETRLTVAAPRLLRGRPVAYIRPADIPDLDDLEAVRGIRTVALAPAYSPFRDDEPQSGYAAIASVPQDSIPLPPDEGPIVGVLDSGVASTHLEDAVVRHDVSVTPSDANPWHGTFVAGLIMAGAHFNEGSYPDDVARVLDAHVLPKQPIDELELYERVREAVLRSQEVKVWNCSFASDDEAPDKYGAFAHQLDELSDEAGVLFVQAAGNLNSPPRAWPLQRGASMPDGLASPAEALRSLTVGARAHLGGYVPAWAPASYSRRGPNFAGLTKPDVSHAGGDRDPDSEIGGFGVFSVIPSGHSAESYGTSFATPAVSAIAANLWAQLEDGGATQPTPELVRGLIVHSAFMNAVDDPAMDDTGRFRQHFGWGTPSSSAFILANESHSLTTVHEVVMTPGINWYKRPFPVPPPLLTADGKFRGEVTLTISYAPPVDAAFESEAVRIDVSGSFGSFQPDGQGGETFSGLTHQGVARAHWERDLKLEGKWSPVKTHRARHVNGVSGGEWGLRLELLERVTNEYPRRQRVYVIVTFRSLDPTVDIYTPGVQALNDVAIAHQQLLSSNRIRLANSGEV